LMANAFRILGGKTSGRAFRDSDLFDNPLAGLVVGILVTVLVQSSSTSTSIIITMTAGDLIEVKNAIPMIMGANIGTSVTNTLVCLGSFANKDEYRRAFAGATVHDCFNFLTVLIFLPIEAATGVLRHIASGICDGMDITDEEEKGSKTDFLKKLTKPVGSRLLGIDKKLITKIAKEQDKTELDKLYETSIIKNKKSDDNHIFMDTPMSDGVAGILMVSVSLLFLCICLMMLVKLLQTIFRGRVAIWFRTVLNLEFESIPGLANYVLIIFGMIITILFQSSSVTTSTLTPLAGIGLVRIEKMFAFTVGANIGTTLTGILSALVSDKRKTGLTVAFTHTLFNLFGTLLWYPIPPIRNVPITMARTLGDIAADWRWFPVVYIVFMFLGLPVVLMGLSIASPWLTVFVGIPLLLFILSVVFIIGLRNNRPHLLPGALKTDARWMPNAIRVEKMPETETQQQRAAVSADLGAENWQLGPAAWGSGWFVLLALLTVVFNNKWADMKYPSWDERNHYGIGGWSVCSYAFEKDMSWAPELDASSCTAVKLDTCGSSKLKDCTKAGFSTEKGANALYEKSWLACREICSAKQWQSWCLKQPCSGDDHSLQCNNVTNAVHRPYGVKYGPSGALAWDKGDICRPVKDICTDVDGPIKIGADLSVTGLASVIVGQTMLLAYSLKPELGNNVLMASCLLFVAAWIFLLASWATFASTIGANASCIVEADSKNGAVIASGKFGDIINGSGSYTFGFVLGAWMLLSVTISLVLLRIKANLSQKPQPAPAPVPEPAPAPVPEPEPKVSPPEPEPDPLQEI